MSTAAKIPFDSLCLAAIAAEFSLILGARCQRVLQPDEFTLVLGLYHGGKEHQALLCCEPEFARTHFLGARPRKVPALESFGLLARTNLDGARLVGVRQVGFDRILHLEFSAGETGLTLVGEFMGKHSNLILVGPNRKIVACARPVGPSKSVRPILIGKTYHPPPFEPKPSLLAAKTWSDVKGSEGASPFFLSVLKATAGDDDARLASFLESIRNRIKTGQFEPCLADGSGAYPIPVDAMGLVARPMPTLSMGLEHHFSGLAESSRIAQRRHSLLSQLDRVALARDAAIHDLELAADTAARAGELQMKAELILAYQHEIQAGQTEFETVDYAGLPVMIPLVADKSPKDNALRLFEKAKRAKSGAQHVQDQLLRLRADRSELIRLAEAVKLATSESELEAALETARTRRWLNVQRVQAGSPAAKGQKSDDPFQGHRIRTTLGPGNVTILYGENATSNDFLTLRVAKPNDYWLHVRGDVSAHVVIQTHNQPTKVGIEVLRYAAEIAVRNSPQKHAKYVPVDYTLKKYVRKPKGAPVGTAMYTHEKTIHVELKG
jgi:predicted ribosome quality control (RQC) complex YloA/Tae2 family protein